MAEVDASCACGATLSGTFPLSSLGCKVCLTCVQLTHSHPIQVKLVPSLLCVLTKSCPFPARVHIVVIALAQSVFPT